MPRGGAEPQRVSRAPVAQNRVLWACAAEMCKREIPKSPPYKKQAIKCRGSKTGDFEIATLQKTGRIQGPDFHACQLVRTGTVKPLKPKNHLEKSWLNRLRFLYINISSFIFIFKKRNIQNSIRYIFLTLVAF